MRSPAAVAQFDPLHRHRADPGLHQTLRAVAMPNQTVTAVRQLDAPHGGKERVGFRFNGLRQQSTRAVPQNRRKRIVDRLGLTKGNHGAIAHRGVSLLQEVQVGFHPPRYAAFLNPPSPSFGLRICTRNNLVPYVGPGT
jgi:hypothetical protein